MITPSSGFTGLVLLVAVVALVSGVSGSLPTRDRPLRLPNETYPLGYQLHISSNIHLGSLLFSGNATIDVEIRQSTNEIVLHAKNLSDFQITVRQLAHSGSDDAVDVVDVVDDLTHTYNPQAAFLIIHPRENYQAFEAGQRYRVEILYTATMRSKPMGLYWMDYVDESTNRTVYVAATQSEPTYARLIFPCYDEPGFKSNFSIRLTHGNNHTAISNMPVKELQHHGELTTTLFEATPPMSTYLVAFVISDFGYISETYRGVTQRIYSSPRSKEKGQSALKNAVRTVAAMEDYFGVSYPLQKLDHIALKKNYGAAMENWGLITFKEGNLLQQDTGDVHKRVKDKITQNHEIAHQWFGNLVSPEWWSYAWMNEGFATYFAYVITDLLYPEDKVMDMFVSDEADRAYSYNSFFDVRPMTSYVETEKDIMAIFDIITYKRAACVIKMFHHAFRQKIFVRGISRFLEKYKYSVANELNLFDYLQAELLEDEYFRQQPWVLRVREIMLSWTHSEWMPIVLVTRNYENDTITFSQRSIHSKSEHWWIPLNFATAQEPCFENTQADLFIPPQTQHSLSLAELNLLNLTGRDWLIVNKQQTGFYHVHYDTDNLRAIARQLRQNHTLIHPVNRAALFRDLKPQIEHTELEEIDVVLDMLQYMELEEDLLPWKQVADTIDFVRRNLFGTSSLELFNEFVRHLVTPIFRRLFRDKASGEVSNSALEAGQEILLMACLADLPECLDYTRTLAKEYIFKKINVTNESEYYAMYDTILCLGVRYLSDKEFYGVIDMLHAADRSSIYYDDMIYSLRCTQSHSHLLYYLDLLLGENSTHLILSDPESMMYLSYLYKSNMEARSVIWQYIDRNYKLLCKSPNFVENFNQIAELVPPQQRPKFVMLRQSIAAYMEAESLNAGQALIEIDSGLVGKKMQNNEIFVNKYERKIHDWLIAEVPQMTAQKEALHAGSPSVGNGSNRPQGLLNAATEVVQKRYDPLIDRSIDDNDCLPQTQADSITNKLILIQQVIRLLSIIKHRTELSTTHTIDE